MKKSGIFQNFMPIIFQTRSETQTPIRKNTLRGSWRAVRVHRRREVGPRRPESVGERSRSGSAKIGRTPKTDRGGCIPRIHPPLCPMQNVFVRPSTSPESARTTPKRENDRRRPTLFGVRLVPVASGAPHQQEDQHAHDGHADDADIGPVPAVVLGDEAQAHARNER